MPSEELTHEESVQLLKLAEDTIAKQDATIAALTAEIEACIQAIPSDCRVVVREGNGPESKAATLAVSVLKLVAEKEAAEKRAEEDEAHPKGSGGNVLRPKLNDCEDALRKAETRIAELESERKPWSVQLMRSGKTMEEMGSDDCKIVDIGYSDRILVVECPDRIEREEALAAELDRLVEAVEIIERLRELDADEIDWHRADEFTRGYRKSAAIKAKETNDDE
jgi:hypothetical protein